VNGVPKKKNDLNAPLPWLIETVTSFFTRKNQVENDRGMKDT